MDERLQRETGALRRSWERHDAAFLRDYLVAGVEDPRINLSSILLRHFLLGLRAGEGFAGLREQELKFAAALNWLLAMQSELADAEGRATLRYGLERDLENVEGLVIPKFLRALWRTLPAAADGVDIPNYLFAPLAAVPPVGGLLATPLAGTFTGLWQAALRVGPGPQPLPTVLELACGSANDFRALAACGLDRWLDYTGVDLSPKNIANARAQFPAARFAEGNALALEAGDRAYDAVVAQDLFEHLSPDALPVALAECGRVARHAVCLGCFSMAELPEHIIRPTEDYHWNTLSLDRVVATFARQGFAARVIHHDTLLRWLLGDAATHNPDAYTLVFRRQPDS
jgi:ubiquinone/menaquinone biosynthesis C-methylase UbiE